MQREGVSRNCSTRRIPHTLTSLNVHDLVPVSLALAVDPSNFGNRNSPVLVKPRQSYVSYVCESHIDDLRSKELSCATVETRYPSCHSVETSKGGLANRVDSVDAAWRDFCSTVMLEHEQHFAVGIGAAMVASPESTPMAEVNPMTSTDALLFGWCKLCARM